MKQALMADGRVSLTRTAAAELRRQVRLDFGDGSSAYCQFFSDGIVLTGYFDSSGWWSFIGPVQANAFFGLEGDSELEDRAVVADGHEACILRNAWERLCHKSG